MSVESIFNWGLQTQIAISILVVTILIIRRAFARAFGAKLAYALWALPLIRLCMPNIILPAPIKAMPVFQAKSTPNADIIMTTEAPLVSTPSLIEYTEILPTALSQNIALICVSIWLSIAVFWLALQLALQIKFMKRTRTHATVPPENIQCLIADLRATLHLNREYNVYMAANNIGPSISGIMRPIIILPHNFETIFTPDQQFHALLHEFTHIKRRDLMAALALLIFRALNWPNPLIHYAAQKCRADLEAACDASVLKTIGHNPDNIQSYAQTLFQAAKSLGANDQNQMNLAFNLVPSFNQTHHQKETTMKLFKLLNLGDNAPLTFGIGHPVTERVERLHGQNKITLKSIVPVLTLTSAMVLALPITTLAADTDVKLPLVIKELSPIQVEIFSSEIMPARKEMTNEAPVLIVEARQIKSSVLPMEIVLRKEMDAQLNEEFLALYKASQHDLAKKQEMIVLSHAFNYTGHLTITVQQSGQYGYKMANGKRNGYDVVHVSPAFQTALQPIMKRCARQAQTSRLPLHFLTQLNVVADGMRTGEFRAKCTPGNVSQRQSLTIDEKIAGLRASTEIPIATRYARARGMRAADYIRKTKANTAMTEVQKEAADKLFLEKLERDFPYYIKSYK